MGDLAEVAVLQFGGLAWPSAPATSCGAGHCWSGARAARVAGVRQNVAGLLALAPASP